MTFTYSTSQEVKVAVVNYGMGNIGSVVKVLKRLNVRHKVTSEQCDLRWADRIILPGVGAFGSAMEKLNELNLVGSIKEQVLEKKKPVLGICLGMQLFAKTSVENKVTTTDYMYDAQPIESVDADLSSVSDADYRRNDNNLNESEESFNNGISKDKEKGAMSDDKLVISAITPATAEVVEEFSMEDDEGYFAEDVSVAGALVTGNNSIDLPVNTRTLAEDSDLIGILYTAM